MHTKMAVQRLLSLDVMRGITIAGMILVNNPGNWEFVYEPLRHAHWHGLTPTDLIFPFFMFIMGVSSYLSLSKSGFKWNKQLLFKILRRSGLIFLVGLFLNITGEVIPIVFDSGISNKMERLLQILPQLRILGVMQRLALAYLFSSLLVMSVSPKRLLYWMGAILVIYTGVLRLGNGYILTLDNIVARVDAFVLGEAHLYTEWLPQGGSMKFDPEGLLSTIPCIVQVLLGFYCGKIIKKNKDINLMLLRLLMMGAVLLFSGLLFNYFDPINKKLWTSSFVLTTCGFAFLFLSLLIWIIDRQKHTRWCHPFEAFGCNPLFIYVVAAVCAPLFGTLGIHHYLVNAYQTIITNNTLVSLLYALTFVAFNWIVAKILYDRKIFIKL